MFVPLDTAQMDCVREILAAFPRLVGELAERNRADPFVIALAKVRRLTVVTEERGGTENRPRIPFVCAHFGVPCMTTLELSGRSASPSADACHDEWPQRAATRLVAPPESRQARRRGLGEAP
jgi:hypothetical protein